MGHGLEINKITNRYEAVYARKPAWHNLGKTASGLLTWEETAIETGLDGSISKRQLEYNGIALPAWGIFRDDVILHDIEAAFIAPTTETFELIQPRYMFSFLDALVEADGKAHYESAGQLRNGKQVWALVNLDAAFEMISGDRYETYLCFTDDRTGKKAAACFITIVRVVCANTFESSYGQIDWGQAVKFRHTKSVADKMSDAVDLFTGARMDKDLLRAKLERLSERQMTKATLAEVLNGLFPAVENETERQQKNRENKMLDILDLYSDNDGNMFPEIRGTAYNLKNAIDEYVDHVQPVKVMNGNSGRTKESVRSERAMFGDGADFKRTALDLILEKTAANPTRKVIYSTASGHEVEVIEPTLDNGSLLDSILEKGVAQ